MEKEEFTESSTEKKKTGKAMRFGQHLAIGILSYEVLALTSALVFQNPVSMLVGFVVAALAVGTNMWRLSIQDEAVDKHNKDLKEYKESQERDKSKEKYRSQEKSEFNREKATSLTPDYTPSEISTDSGVSRY